MNVQWLDRKHSCLVEVLHRRISEGTFGETDVLGLLVLLRPIACDPIREFGHAIAHRKRNRGQILSYLRESYHLLNRPLQDRDAAIKDALYIRGEIGRSLNQTLASLELSPLDALRMDDFAVVVASLLQDLRFADRGVRRLRFGIAPRFVGVWGEIEFGKNICVVPVFGVENRYLQFSIRSKLGPYVPRLNDALVAVESRAGKLSFLAKYGDNPPGIPC